MVNLIPLVWGVHELIEDVNRLLVHEAFHVGEAGGNCKSVVRGRERRERGVWNAVFGSRQCRHRSLGDALI